MNDKELSYPECLEALSKVFEKMEEDLQEVIERCPKDNIFQITHGIGLTMVQRFSSLINPEFLKAKQVIPKIVSPHVVNPNDIVPLFSNLATVKDPDIKISNVNGN